MKITQFSGLLFILILISSGPIHAQGTGDLLKERLLAIRSVDSLKQVDSVLLDFPTYHPQGLTKVGAFFFLTAVEVKRWPRTYGKIMDGYDRDVGEGVGHVFKFNDSGILLGKVTIGQGDVYHPGGIDFDGRHIWIPVCEYRPNGQSAVYRLDPETLEAKKMWTSNDALGAVICVGQDEVIGMNWNSEKFYRWKRRKGQADTWQEVAVDTNHHYTFRIQDGQYIGNDLMLCSGLNRWEDASGTFVLGGLQLLSTKDYRSVYNLPVPLKTTRGNSLNSNPFYAEITDREIRCYFAPDDDRSILYIYAKSK